MKYFSFLWADLWRKPARTFLTLLSIVVAFLLYGILQGVDSGFAAVQNLAHDTTMYSINRISIGQPMPLAYRERMARVPGVTAVSAGNAMGVYYQMPKNNFAAQAQDLDAFLAIRGEIQLPEEQRAAAIRTRTGALVGAPMAAKYGWKVGDRVPLKSFYTFNKDGTKDWVFDVVAIYDSPSNPTLANQFFISFDYFDEARASDNGTVGLYTISIADPAQQQSIAAAIDEMFKNSGDETRTLSEKVYGQYYAQRVGDIRSLVTVVVGAIFFTLLFLTGNTMMQAFRERTREVGTLKTLGFSDRSVLLLILGESVLLCMLGALIGLAAALAVFPSVSNLVTLQSGGVVITLSAQVIAGAALIAIVLAIVSGAIPAWRASRLMIVDSLRRG